jgi:hypothetical protein
MKRGEREGDEMSRTGKAAAKRTIQRALDGMAREMRTASPAEVWMLRGQIEELSLRLIEIG